MCARSPNEHSNGIREEGKWASTNLCCFSEVQMKYRDSNKTRQLG